MATSISSVTGTFGYDNSLTINGSGFGTKSTSKPLSYCDFQNGTVQPNSAVSTNTTLFGVENANYVSSSQARWGNGGCAQAAWLRNSTSSGNSAALVVNTNWGYSTRNLFCFAYRKWLNADTGGNWKTWRYWSSGLTYPDSYLGSPDISGAGGAGWIWTIENIGFTEGVNHKWLSGGLQPTSTWRSEMLFLKHNSSASVVDGSLSIYFNGLGGTTVMNQSPFTFSYAGTTNTSKIVYLEDTKANSNPGGSMQSFYGDYYVDYGFNQVFMGNAATWAACNHIEVQPYTSFADGQIVIKQRPGTFLSGTNTYLYVLDVNGSPNATGYNLSNLNPSPAPPTLVSISPTSGPTTGQTGVVGTCTGLTATLSGVSVGGTAANNVVRDSATQFTADFPAKAAGTYNVVVTNSNATTGTLLNGWTAVTAPTVTSCAIQISAYTNTPGESPKIWMAPQTLNSAAHWYPTGAGFGPKNVIVNGTNFVATGVTTVVIGGRTGTNVRYVSSTQLLVDFHTTGLAAGTLNTVVTNPDGQTSGATGNGTFVTSATAPWIYYALAAFPTTGNVSAYSYIMANLVSGNAFTVTVGGTLASSAVITTLPDYNFQLVIFDAPAKVVGNYDIVLTDTDLSQSYTFTGGAHYANLSGGIF